MASRVPPLVNSSQRKNIKVEQNTGGLLWSKVRDDSKCQIPNDCSSTSQRPKGGQFPARETHKHK